MLNKLVDNEYTARNIALEEALDKLSKQNKQLGMPDMNGRELPPEIEPEPVYTSPSDMALSMPEDDGLKNGLRRISGSYSPSPMEFLTGQKTKAGEANRFLAFAQLGKLLGNLGSSALTGYQDTVVDNSAQVFANQFQRIDDNILFELRKERDIALAGEAAQLKAAQERMMQEAREQAAIERMRIEQGFRDEQRAKNEAFRLGLTEKELDFRKTEGDLDRASAEKRSQYGTKTSNNQLLMKQLDELDRQSKQYQNEYEDASDRIEELRDPANVAGMDENVVASEIAKLEKQRNSARNNYDQVMQRRRELQGFSEDSPERTGPLSVEESNDLWNPAGGVFPGKAAPKSPTKKGTTDPGKGPDPLAQREYNGMYHQAVTSGKVNQGQLKTLVDAYAQAKGYPESYKNAVAIMLKTDLLNRGVAITSPIDSPFSPREQPQQPLMRGSLSTAEDDQFSGITRPPGVGSREEELEKELEKERQRAREKRDQNLKDRSRNFEL